MAPTADIILCGEETIHNCIGHVSYKCNAVYVRASSLVD